MGVSKFLRDQSGAITVDWVTLSAGILLAGATTVYAVLGDGMSVVSADLNQTLAESGVTADPGAAQGAQPVAGCRFCRADSAAAG